MSTNNNPPTYPLKDASPVFDFKIVNPASKLSDTWLQREYQKLSLISPEQSSRENRKRIRKGDEIISDEERDTTESCDDMAISDTECNSQVSNQSAIMSGLSNSRENGLVHPPKRRLTSVMSPSLLEDAQQGLAVTHSRTPNAMNSPTQTPVSDMEEQPQQLPLPSPSASPVQSTKNSFSFDTIENQLSNVPSTQAELLEMIVNLSGYLSDKNQNHLIFRLLQGINRSSLSSIGDLIQGSLKRDMISNLPLEISYKILDQLDYRTLLSISLVCTNWYKIINNSSIWTGLLKRDKLMTNEAKIEDELNSPNLLKDWSMYPDDSNRAQVLYRKKCTIFNRWMDPKFEPKRISVAGNGNNVVTCLQHDEDKIVTGVDDKLISIYSTKSGELLKVLKGHEGGVWALKYVGNTLVSGSTDRTVRIWNLKTGKCTHVFRGHTSTVRCLDILQPVKIGEDDNGDDIIFPENPLLVTGSRDHHVHVWKLPLIDEDYDEPQFDSAEAANPYLMHVLEGHTQSVRTVSAYGNLIVSGSYDTTVRVWDLLDNGKCKYILTGHGDRIYSTAINFKTMRCYSGSMDSTINVWDMTNGSLLHTLQGHTSLVGLLELSDEYLVSAAADATLRVWDPKTGEQYSKLKGHTGAITCFQHDSLRIVSGSEGMLKLWDIKNGKFIRDLLADISGNIWQVRFDANSCVAAVQRTKNDVQETFIEIMDFSVPPAHDTQ
ncbi:uncharacterized protein PRCAT00004599001 [Priceomyces carsonii]|uniref:uncharacterized protein n=1 Tax=Priceomyces carsonii TaxID=28549 RepID=UPI002EDAECE7|nr:unnamed protein product [Priceomyces carsonii]